MAVMVGMGIVGMTMLFCWLTLVVPLGVPALDFHPLLSEGQPDGDGLRLRLLPRAIRYLNQLAHRLIAHHLPRIVIPDVRQTLEQGYVTLTNIHISRFKHAQQHNITTSPPNKILWSVERMDLGLIGDLGGHVNVVLPLELEGQAEVVAEGISFRLQSALERGADGAPVVAVLACEARIALVHIANHNGGFAGLAINTFKTAIADNIRPLLQTLICRRLRRFIEEDLNEKLASTGRKRSLQEAIAQAELRPPRRRRRMAKLDRLSGSISSLNITRLLSDEASSKLFIDYRLKESPRVYDNVVELASYGEISYLGSGSTPFRPPKLTWPTSNHSAMLHLLISDFLPNSMLYHSFKERMLRFRLGPDSPDLEGFLRTSCRQDVLCISDVVPQLGETYPNASVELVFSAIRAPAMLFSAKQEGVISVNINGLVVLYVELEKKRKRQAAIFELDVVADTKLKINGHFVAASISLNRFHLNNKYGSLGLGKEELSDLALLSAEMLENIVNKVLSYGLPLPVPSVLTLENASIAILNRKMMISSDFRVDEKKLSALASETFGLEKLLSI